MIRKSPLRDMWGPLGVYRKKKMKTARIVRDPSTPLGTSGAVTAGAFYGYSLEPNDHNNATGISCIPLGKYRCEIVDSPKFGRVFEIKGVKDRTSVLIHWGNFAADAPGKSDSEGCVMIGNALGEIAGQFALLGSKDGFNRFMAEMNGDPFELEITKA